MSDIEQHVEAVAQFMPTPHGIHARVAARELLTSTDPAVHAAMLDALTRHGVLTEERHLLCTGCGAIESRPGVTSVLSHFMHDMDVTPEDAPEVVERRFVTTWEAGA